MPVLWAFQTVTLQEGTCVCGLCLDQSAICMHAWAAVRHSRADEGKDIAMTGPCTGVSDHDLLFSEKEAHAGGSSSGCNRGLSGDTSSCTVGLSEPAQRSLPAGTAHAPKQGAAVLFGFSKRACLCSTVPWPRDFSHLIVHGFMPSQIHTKPRMVPAAAAGRGAWQGSGDISDMFARALTLNLPGQAASRSLTPEENDPAAR